jgi:hypothetical protein
MLLLLLLLVVLQGHGRGPWNTRSKVRATIPFPQQHNHAATESRLHAFSSATSCTCDRVSLVTYMITQYD